MKTLLAKLIWCFIFLLIGFVTAYLVAVFIHENWSSPQAPTRYAPHTTR